MAVSTAVNLAEKGKRVLFVDADPQGNATAWMIGDTAIAHDLANVLFKRCTTKDAITAIPKTDGIPPFPDTLSLIPTASLVDMRSRYDTEKKPILARLVLNSRNKSQKSQDDYMTRIVAAANAQGQSVYVVPIDQAFKKALVCPWFDTPLT